MRLGRLLAPIAICATLSTTTLAQQVDWKTRSAARSLGVEAIQLESQGKLAEALDRYERAHALFPAPTLGVGAARCLEKLGRLVEAAERYREVATAQLGPNPQFQYLEAQAEAMKAREALLPRIPALEVVVKGDRGEGITVLVDDEVLPPELVDTSHPVDPGEHEVRVRRGDVTITQRTRVGEGETARVVLSLPPLPLEAKHSNEPEVAWETWMWVSYGVGAGGVLAAVINGSIALSQNAHLEKRCPGRICPPSAHDAADAFDATRVATTVGFVVGGVGIAAGTLLFFLAPDEEAGVAVGTDGLNLYGRF